MLRPAAGLMVAQVIDAGRFRVRIGRKDVSINLPVRVGLRCGVRRECRLNAAMRRSTGVMRIYGPGRFETASRVRGVGEVTAGIQPGEVPGRCACNLVRLIGLKRLDVILCALEVRLRRGLIRAHIRRRWLASNGLCRID